MVDSGIALDTPVQLDACMMEHWLVLPGKVQERKGRSWHLALGRVACQAPSRDFRGGTLFGGGIAAYA